MTHQQILDKLSAKYLIQALDEDLCRLLSFAVQPNAGNESGDLLQQILPQLLRRWNCVFEAGAAIPDSYKQKAQLALALLLHKYGLADPLLTQKALAAIGQLNAAVVLSDDFFRKSDEIAGLLSMPPQPMKRRPSLPETMTFYRAKDVVAIELEGRFYAAYIHQITGLNESPVLEFYRGVFGQLPSLRELEQLPAIGQIYNDGTERISHFAISGMKYQPDPAAQVSLIASCVETAPANSQLKESVGLYALTDLFRIQATIDKMFGICIM